MNLKTLPLNNATNSLLYPSQHFMTWLRPEIIIDPAGHTPLSVHHTRMGKTDTICKYPFIAPARKHNGHLISVSTTRQI